MKPFQFHLFRFIKEKLGFTEEEEDDFSLGLKEGEDARSVPDVLQHSTKRRRDLNVLDYRERESYIRGCCEQMTSSSKEVESQKTEYQLVTERLTDLEELSALPASNRNEIKKLAMKIVQIETDEASYERPVSKITEAQYREIERMEDEIPQILERLKKNEEYQMAVRRDLNLLEGEKGALAFQHKEENQKAAGAKTFAIIIVFAAVLVVCLLIVLKASLPRMDVKLAYFIMAAIAAAALTVVSVLYRSAQDNQTRAEKKLNRIITLQNTVKVKYVNITNLIDYTYTKYKVNNSYELNYIWEKYLEEKEARSHTEKVAQKMEQARKELLLLLGRYHIKEPALWIYQPGVMIYEDELKEMRHSLIVQRQRLRKGIDFNLYNLEDSKKEIEHVVKDYPQYAREILAIVSQYE
ncbi:MAG: hypothetical protein QM697_10395 [Lachnospiraceae bacterium]